MGQSCVLITFKPISDTFEATDLILTKRITVLKRRKTCCQAMLTFCCIACVHVTVAESITNTLPKAERNAESNRSDIFAAFVMYNSVILHDQC